MWHGASGVTFDEELLCVIGICIRPSVQELRRWAWLKVNTEGLVSEKVNVFYKNWHCSVIQHLKLPHFTYFQSNLRCNTVCIVKWPECHTNLKTIRTWDVESHPKFAIKFKYTVCDVTFDEEFVSAIEIGMHLSVHEFRRWVDLEVNIVVEVLEKPNVCYEN